MRVYLALFFLWISLCGYSQDYDLTIKPFDEVITAESISQKGFLISYQLNNKLYLEVPSSMLDKDMMLVRFNKVEEYIIKWIKKGNSIQLVMNDVESRVGNIIPLIKNKFNLSITPVIFPILTKKSQSQSYVIDVTNLFLNPPLPFSSSKDEDIDLDMGFINKVVVFDSVIDVKTIKMVNTEKGRSTINDDFSLVLLPKPMTPRLFDYRMGFFNEEYEVLDLRKRSAISKWRLERIDYEKEFSEPIKPITFYLDPNIPEKWKSYVKAGIYEWIPAFEAAGFINAIIVKEVPLEDSKWSMDSMEYSFIKWINNSNYRGFEGEGRGSVNTIIDKRTGEILKADIMIGEINTLVERYFTRCSPLDKRAQKYPFPDDLIGELIQSLTAHEAGHAFGIRDANYGEYAYPFEKMRDIQWLEKMGHTPSIMSYSRENFIAQPEDSIPPKLLQQKVGPMDVYNIRWAYSQFQGIDSADKELPNLEKIIREQDSILWYRFNSNYYKSFQGFYEAIGPGCTNEVVESDNPIKATILGLKNIQRVINIIPNAFINERDNTMIDRFYNLTLELWSSEMKSVVSLVGGYTIHYKSGIQNGAVYTPVPEDRQKEAITFLNKHAFSSIFWLTSPEITRRFETNGTLRNVSKRQLSVLSDLLSFTRLKNLEEVSFTENKSYDLNEMFQDLQSGLWNELEDGKIKINPFRQEIQIAFISILKSVIKSKRGIEEESYLSADLSKYKYSNYIRGEAYYCLNRLKAAIENVIVKVKDSSTKGHLNLCLQELNDLEN